jgi:isoleucyl-tRNA synthetase
MSVDFPKEEERILEHWKEINAFLRQVELSKGKKPYTFYDGPPFATGLPHYGHLLASTIKDIIPRYWSMKGRYVERRFGWDTHGVPIEHEIDKKLGISGRDAVLQMGIEKYNAECKAIVMRYASEWRQTIDRLGRWIDFDNDYKVGDSLTGSSIVTVDNYYRPWTPHTWNQSGGCSSSYGEKTQSTGDSKSCPFLLP